MTDLAAASPAVAPPPGNPRFPLFDSLRGLAVLAVVVYHVFIFSGALNRRGIGDAVAVLGSLGPILFFALSGFLLYRPWVAARATGKPPPDTLRYGRRRALRILPAYWFALTVLALWPGIAGPFTGDWWRYYLFLQLYDARTLGLGIPVAWTLCVEVTFYLALPLWAAALRRAGLATELWALAGLAAAGAAVQIAAGREAISDTWASSLPGECLWFALGMALAVLSVGRNELGNGWRTRLDAVARRPLACWAVAAAAYAGIVALRAAPGGLFGIVRAIDTVQPYPKLVADLALTATMIAAAMVPALDIAAGGLPRRVLAAAPLALLGVISYGVYLWHLTIAELLILPAMPTHFDARGLGLGADIGNGGTPLLLVATLAVTCLVAATSYRFVELPFLRRKER